MLFCLSLFLKIGTFFAPFSESGYPVLSESVSQGTVLLFGIGIYL